MEVLEIAPPEPKLHEGEESKFSKASRPKKLIASGIVYYCTFAFGICLNILGPTVVDFSNKFNTDVSHVSTVFTILLTSYLISALLNGIFNHFIDRQKIVLFVTCIGVATIYIFPHISTINGFFAGAVFLGLYAGGYDSAQVAWIIDIWRHEAPPFILTQHFFYSLGTIVPPLIIAPFLKGKGGNNGQSANNTISENEANNNNAALLAGNSTQQIEIREGSILWIPFTMAGSVLFVGLLLQIIFYFRFSSSSSSGKILKQNNVPPKSVQNSKFEFPELKQVVLIALSCCSMSFYVGMEVCTMQFLPTFAHFSTIALTEAESANVLFGLTLSFCLCRGGGIFLVLKTPSHLIIFGNFIILVLANLILAFLADESVTWMWIGSVLIGAGFSTTFPAYFAYIEKYLFISDTVAGLILGCAGAVSAIYPIIVGGLVEANPIVLIYVNFLSMLILIFSFSFTFWLTFWRGSPECRKD